MAVESLAAVYATYIFASASPGPSVMAIMGTAMAQGRRPALTLALGVIGGSMTWAGLASLGLTALLATHAGTLSAVRIAGGCYLLWLAVKAAKAAGQTAPAAEQAVAEASAGLWKTFRQGYLMHLTNPKAILSWSAILSLALNPERAAGDLPLIVGGCCGLGLVIFCGYAVAFSTPTAVRLYGRARRGIQGLLAIGFTTAGLSLIVSRG